MTQVSEGTLSQLDSDRGVGENQIDMKTSGGTEYKEVISVISRSPRDRPREGLIVVKEWLKSCSTLFAGMNGDILLEVAKNCTCQIMRKDSMVVKQGDRGNSFYIILHGDVSIYVKEGK